MGVRARFPLGSSTLMVGPVCLGTMTFGLQNTEQEAHEQLDYAIKERGVNFVDTAELYPVPTTHPDYKPGRTELFIGSWIKRNPQLRKDIVIATKVAGYMLDHPVARLRGVKDCRLDPASIYAACDASLERLNVSYIDLYQLHWPDRYCPGFGTDEYKAEKERDSIPIKETLVALKTLLDQGKILAYGLSNETSYGVCEFVRLADELGMPRPVSIQNSFSLLHRSFESELAETCAKSHHNLGLLPWSPLAGGMLTGKYLPGNPDGDKGRLRIFKGSNYQQRFCSERSMKATTAYARVAEEAGLSLTQLALAFCKTRKYVTSTIIGATNLKQLKENIDAFEDNNDISQDVQKKIDVVSRETYDPIQNYVYE